MLASVKNARKKKKRVDLSIIVGVFILAFDQWLKFFSCSQGSTHLIPSPGQLTLIKNFLFLVPGKTNPGIAFGLLSNYGGILLIPALIATILLIFIYCKLARGKILLKWGVVLILSGALSNLLDRVLGGSVIDYLLLRYFPYTFNLADVSILAGTGIVLKELWGKQEQISTVKQEDSNRNSKHET